MWFAIEVGSVGNIERVVSWLCLDPLCELEVELSIR